MNTENVNSIETNETVSALPTQTQDVAGGSMIEAMHSDGAEASQEDDAGKSKGIHHTINPSLDMKRFDLDDEDKIETITEKDHGAGELPLVFGGGEGNKENEDSLPSDSDAESGDESDKEAELESNPSKDVAISRNLEKLFAGWEEKSSRHENLEAFKNGYALPFLMELGYDIFNVDHVAPLESGGGYVINNGSGRFLLSLKYETLTDINDDDVFLHLTRDAFTIGTSKIEYISGQLKDLASLYLIEHFKADNLDVMILKNIEETYSHDQEKITTALIDIITSENSPIIGLIAERMTDASGKNGALLRERIQIALSTIITKG